MKKRILVFGTGFISKNIFEQREVINNQIEKIISVSLDSKFDFSDKHVETKISDLKKIRTLIYKEKINSIFFFIGPSFPSISFENILYDVNNCLTPYIELLKLVNEYNIADVALLSSGGTIYGSRIEKSFQEDEIIMQQSAYGIMFKTLENYLLLFANKYKFKYKILRLSNVYGKYHQSENNGIINILVRSAIKDLPVKIFSPNLSKNYIYSKDVGKIFWKLNSIKDNAVINISSEFNFNNLEICEKIKLAFPNLRFEIFDENLKYDTTPPEISNSKLMSLANFEFTCFEKAINETIEWEKTNLI